MMSRLTRSPNLQAAGEVSEAEEEEPTYADLEAALGSSDSQQPRRPSRLDGSNQIGSNTPTPAQASRPALRPQPPPSRSQAAFDLDDDSDEVSDPEQPSADTQALTDAELEMYNTALQRRRQPTYEDLDAALEGSRSNGLTTGGTQQEAGQPDLSEEDLRKYQEAVQQRARPKPLTLGKSERPRSQPLAPPPPPPPIATRPRRPWQPSDSLEDAKEAAQRYAAEAAAVVAAAAIQNQATLDALATAATEHGAEGDSWEAEGKEEGEDPIVSHDTFSVESAAEPAEPSPELRLRPQPRQLQQSRDPVEKAVAKFKPASDPAEFRAASDAAAKAPQLEPDQEQEQEPGELLSTPLLRQRPAPPQLSDQSDLPHELRTET